MEIKHISNSFITVYEGKTILSCDPWVGITADNAWLSYPHYKKGKSILNNIKPNFIYISHLHGDHLDQPTLKKYKNKNVTIIIKKFKSPRLKNKIKEAGFKNIIECNSWEKYKLSKDLTISIVPQLSSNSQEIDEQISYDLDTSILIHSNKTNKNFFNSVDNPLSFKNLKKVKSHCKKVFNKGIDVVCFAVGAASEYPHCFTNINRAKEKQKVINDSLNRVMKKLNVLKPKVYFPAGGSYQIYGKFSKLSKYIAQPKYFEIKKKFEKNGLKTFNIEGGRKLIEKGQSWEVKKDRDIKNYVFEENKISSTFLKKPYFFANKFKNITIEAIDDQFQKASFNYKNILKKFPIKTSWDIEFCIYKNLIIDKIGKIVKKKSKVIKTYKLSNLHNKNKSKYSSLKCHLDYNLFYGLLKRKYVWNTALSGSIVIFERKPNFFDPNVTFSLNFLSNK